jgi:hypothetical protein
MLARHSRVQAIQLRQKTSLASLGALPRLLWPRMCLVLCLAPTFHLAPTSQLTRYVALLACVVSQTVRSDLAIAAYGRACDRTRISPFVRRGVEAGCLDGAKVAAGAHCGGKLDDITCVLSRCVIANHAAGHTENARGSAGAVGRPAAGGAAKGATGAAGPSRGA